jgi:hypothetical protein
MSGVTCMQAMGETMQIFNVLALGQRAQQLLLQRRAPMTTGALAVALAVPFWVADVVMDSLQEQGDACHAPDGWRLCCSAAMALALSLPATLRPTSPGGAA